MFCSETPLKVADVLSTMSRRRVGGCVNIDIDVIVFAASELAASTLRGRRDDFNCRNEITRQLIIPLANAKTGWLYDRAMEPGPPLFLESRPT